MKRWKEKQGHNRSEDLIPEGMENEEEEDSAF
jgi:hypothetical protein